MFGIIIIIKIIIIIIFIIIIGGFPHAGEKNLRVRVSSSNNPKLDLPR